MESPGIQEITLEQQRRKVTELYDQVAGEYNANFEGKAEYQIPKILLEVYSRHNISSGELLDIGCGTGKLKEYLGEGFSYSGIDISSGMTEEARKNGFYVINGPVEEVIKTFDDKSVDHVTAMSSLYFVRDYELLMKEIERVARQSLFVSLEQFTPEIAEMMRKRGINIYNHLASIIENPTEVIRNTFLWKRPHTEDRIYGDIVFKKLIN
jgi:ubiquinone/menaquinone biosynthesis C-methylase UbiE